MKIAAGILAYSEHPSMVDRASRTVECLDLVFSFGQDVEIHDEKGEAAARAEGLRLAREQGADWYLQIDADERLLSGERLYDYLPLADAPWWPLPYVQEQGWTTVAPCKLIRVDGAECVLASDVYRFGGGEPVLLSGFTWPTEYDPLLPGLPRLLHVPSERPDAGTRRRLSVAIEGSDQAGRIGSHKPELSFIVPRAQRTEGSTMSQIADDRTEWEAKDGAFYCPGCGQRYDTAGLCEGPAGAGHEAIEVVSIKSKPAEGDDE